MQTPKYLGISKEGHTQTVKKAEGVQELKDLTAWQYNRATVLFQGIRKIEDKKISKAVLYNGKFHIKCKLIQSCQVTFLKNYRRIGST